MPTKPNPHTGKLVPEPCNHLVFDPWQSVSTGHQVANAGYSAHGTTGWRNMRSAKLSEQYKSGDCNSRQGYGHGHTRKEITSRSNVQQQSLVPGAFDGRVPKRAVVPTHTSTRRQAGLLGIRGFMGVSKRKAGDDHYGSKSVEEKVEKKVKYTEKENHAQVQTQDRLQSGSDSSSTSTESNPSLSLDLSLSLKAQSTIFAGLTIYINGSTLPRISDHKLKLLLTSHGANYTIYMARKTVTHVVIGQPNAVGSGGGAGGGLSASKLQQEIERGGWKGVKVVSVDWAIESIKAGRRLAESRFPGMHVAAKGQRSVVGMFGAQTRTRAGITK
ncbi:uncharacterized protein N7511_002775 [Penicillium nucicola]|uniref:uncharacterized protein n=1 Tax=Penicillium nucicola TaxID=1850975 RepID=UPI0025458BEF|nr:uncharacterized protein N7511_002775 [Penicillium nucicola]KAJ5770724.1 hypothetical protein N7511_002775 [Penicillium nucicola]